MSILDTFNEMSTVKKIASIVVVCCVFLLIFAVLGGGGSPDKNTSADNKDYDLENTLSVKADYGIITIDGIHAADITQYNSTDAIEEQILSKDTGVIFKKVTSSGASEVSSIDDYNGVYEYLSNEGFYYSFVGKDNKTYIITINEDNWKADMLSEMDEFCLQNAK